MKKLALALIIVCAPNSAAACHKFSFWHYPWPQHCGFSVRPPPVLPPERIEVGLPTLKWVDCPEGDERLKGIAFLRSLQDVR